MTATRPRPGRTWAVTALSRAIGAIRSANDELLRANEAIFRPAGVPRGGDSGAGGPGQAA
ncbi:MAG TPA: hypothetical protein VLW50_13775 [Streptosporangiaceae bacterium]|nr:hypothetical protein [Streptosporangiaceae bacterium]